MYGDHAEDLYAVLRASAKRNAAELAATELAATELAGAELAGAAAGEVTADEVTADDNARAGAGSHELDAPGNGQPSMDRLGELAVPLTVVVSAQGRVVAEAIARRAPDTAIVVAAGSGGLALAADRARIGGGSAAHPGPRRLTGGQAPAARGRRGQAC